MKYLAPVVASVLVSLNAPMTSELLQAHNTYRYAANVPDLVWDENLSREAQQYAQHLADTHSFEHSEVKNEGENLWMGTTHAFSLTQMVAGWGAEQKYYKPGIFPNVSTTGDWTKVGHYTQLIDRKSSHVGCGVASDAQYDILVCRYSPPGNVVGESVD